MHSFIRPFAELQSNYFNIVYTMYLLLPIVVHYIVLVKKVQCTAVGKYKDSIEH